MALPAGKGGNVENIVTEIKGLVSGLLFQVATNTKDSNHHLAAIKLRTQQMSGNLDTLGAMAELEFEQMTDDADPEPEDELEAPDAEKALTGGDGDESPVSLLKEIRDATKETAEHTKVLADAEKNRAEDVLDPTDPDDIEPPTGGKTKSGTKAGKSGGLMKALAIMLGGIIGTIAGIFSGWLKALKFVFNRGFIKTLSTTFANFFKGLKTSFKGGAIAKGFARIGKFFKSIGSFFGRVFKIFSTIGGFFKTVVGVASKVMAVVSKIFAPLLIIMGIFETIKGFFEGFANTEGSLVDKIIGGLAGALTGFLDFLIAAPLNLVKDLIGWIAGALGFEGVKDKLDGFDFSFGGIVDAVMNVMKYVANVALKIIKFPYALAAGIAGGIAALMPGGMSPKEGFMKGFNAVMNAGQTPIEPKTEDTEVNADKLAPSGSGDQAEKTKSSGDVSGSDEESDSIYPFKISGMKELGQRHDEYTIEGKNKKGQYIGKDPRGRKVTAVEPAVITAIDNQVNNLEEAKMQAETAAFSGQLDSANMMSRNDSSQSGVTLADRQKELAEKRAGYAQGGQGRFTNNTNIGGSNSSVSNQVIVKKEPDANFKRNRINPGLPR